MRGRCNLKTRRNCSMNYKIEASSYFVVAAKRLSKHYPSFKKDYARFLSELKENPWQGVDLGNGIRKIRMQITSKGRGKSGGARAITMNIVINEENMKIRLLLLYDKKEADNYNEKALEAAIKEF